MSNDSKPDEIIKIDEDFASFAMDGYKPERAEMMAFYLAEKMEAGFHLSGEQTFFLQRFINERSENGADDKLKNLFSSAEILLNNDGIISESEVGQAREYIGKYIDLVSKKETLTPQQYEEAKTEIKDTVKWKGDVAALTDGYLGVMLERDAGIKRPKMEVPTFLGSFTGGNKEVAARNKQANEDYDKAIAEAKAENLAMIDTDMDADPVIKQVMNEFRTESSLQFRVLDDSKPYGNTDNTGPAVKADAPAIDLGRK